MSHIHDDDPPIKTGPASQAYKDGWDRIFGEKHVDECLVPSCPGCSDGEPEAADEVPHGQGYYTCLRCGNQQPAYEGPNHRCPHLG